MSHPEFLLNLHKLPGTPVGRLYIPAPWTSTPEFANFRQSVSILESKCYPNGAELIWFVAPISVYRNLAFRYPHSYHSAYTLYLLEEASTFFRGLKPPHDFFFGSFG